MLVKFPKQKNDLQFPQISIKMREKGSDFTYSLVITVILF